jgi:hypothetical protein
MAPGRRCGPSIEDGMRSSARPRLGGRRARRARPLPWAQDTAEACGVGVVTGFQTLYTARPVSFQRSIAGLAADIELPTEAPKARIGRERQLNEFVASFEKRVGPPRHVAPRSILFSNHGPLGAPDPPLTAGSDGLFFLPRPVQLRYVRNGSRPCKKAQD